ncbi:U2-type spliceosomal complex subunit CWC25 [Sporobolomyces koalae]|uniref:U2-type spliceosomal complex subunit CWC25 n=1 Tax=Sporobolomyces koalae TaxID=500713 RepID=UPI00317E40CF
MGGGDLNMKKSWHTGTFHNQERVWKKEQEALAERKKVQQLQKELEQERAVQELQRLQAEAGGGKREERVEWLYAAPAEGNGPNAEELEAYLLGKKRVDKLLKGNEEKLMADSNTANAPGGTFTASTTANTARDTAAKIREDPLLAIKRQEQLQYEKMLKDPKRLKELRAAKAGQTSSSSRDGETKEERRARREARRADREDRHRDRDRAKHGSRRSREDSYDRDRHHRSSRKTSPDYRSRSRSRSPRRSDGGSYRTNGSASRYGDREASSRDETHNSRYHDRLSHRASPPPRPNNGFSDRRRSPPPHDARRSSSFSNDRNNGYRNSTRAPPPPPPAGPTREEEEARQAAVEARLAAMQSSAASLSTSRAARLTAMEAFDAAEKEKEDKMLRERGRAGDGTGPRFMRDVEKGVFSGQGGVGERIKRSGKVGMVGDRE